MTIERKQAVYREPAAANSWAASSRLVALIVATGVLVVAVACTAWRVGISSTAVRSPVSPAAPSAISSPVFASPTAQDPKVQTSASGLAQLPVNAALMGSTAIAWADASLDALGAPTTIANVQTMVDWFANEGTPHDLNNPLNLQTPFGGSVVSTAGGSPAGDRIQAYPTPDDFVAAFPIEMNSGSYSAIVAALKAGKGLEGSASNSKLAAELSVYSGGGYDSIPAVYDK